MSISDAVRLLEALAKKYGGNGDHIQVYFDCPHCGREFRPTTVEAEVKYEPRVVIPAADRGMLR